MLSTSQIKMDPKITELHKRFLSVNFLSKEIKKINNAGEQDAISREKWNLIPGKYCDTIYPNKSLVKNSNLQASINLSKFANPKQKKGDVRECYKQILKKFKKHDVFVEKSKENTNTRIAQN